MSIQYSLIFDFESHYDRRWIKLYPLSPEPPFEVSFGSHKGMDSHSLSEFNDILNWTDATKSDIIFDLINEVKKNRVPIRINLSELQSQNESVGGNRLDVSKQIAALMEG